MHDDHHMLKLFQRSHVHEPQVVLEATIPAPKTTLPPKPYQPTRGHGVNPAIDDSTNPWENHAAPASAGVNRHAINQGSPKTRT
jgi:hypothetical protein